MIEEALILKKGKSDGSHLRKVLGEPAFFEENDLVGKTKNKVKELLKQRVVPFTELQDAVAKIIENIDIFISFSHKDDEYAILIAKYLTRRFRVFVDPLFWGSVDAALKIYVDKKRMPSDTESESYKKIIEASEIFHALLADSLKKTIQNSARFLFIQSENSLHPDGTTYSPWLYLENTYCLDCLPESSKFLFEELGDKNAVRFPMYCDYFDPIDEDGIIDLVKPQRRFLF